MDHTPSSATIEPGEQRHRRHRRKHSGRSQRKKILRNIVVGLAGCIICLATYYYWQHLVG